MTAYQTIRRFFQREWGNRIPLLEGASGDANPGDPYWARFHYLEEFGEELTRGTTVTHVKSGLVTIQIFSRDRAGLSRLRAYAEQAGAILRSKTLRFGTNGRLVLKTELIRMVASGEPPMCNCTVEWWSDEDHVKPAVE